MQLKIKLKYNVEISTNMWIPLSSHIYSHRSRPWCTSFVMAPEGLSFYSTMKRVDRGTGMKGYDWPLSKGRAGGEAGARMSGTLPDSG